MSVQIIIDSTVDLRPELLSEVKIAPLSIRFGEEEYVDGKTLTKQEFYKKLTINIILSFSLATVKRVYFANYYHIVLR